ncbi:hypothetical protein LCGC14_1350790, partial [marine sediment metagenome]
YKARPVTSSLVARPRGIKQGSRRLPEETEAVIAEALKQFYKSRQMPNITSLHKEIQRLCRLRNLHAPSWQALRSRIDDMDPAELAKSREGARVARDRYRPVPGQYSAERAFEVVQIDHTPVDIIVVDRLHRQPLQRPWLTLAIDVASRMVAGFYLSLEPPSTLSVALVIQHLVQPKEAWLSGLGIDANWPAAGLPETIHVDNAREFHSRSLQRGAEEHGIALKHRPVAVPHYGGHIERLIGTMMGAVHLLPGTTFSNIQDRGDYDSAAHATMTLDELEHWMTLEIFRYHSDIHRTLAIPPLAAWQDALGRRTTPLRQPHDPASFRIDFLPSVERMVRRDGIHLFGLRYWDDVLSVWAGRHGRQLRVSYDPRDLSTVYVRGPDGTRYPVRFADLRHPPITLAEHRRAQKLLKERGLELVDEQLIFQTIEQQRAMVDVAMAKTREARRMGERRDRALSGNMAEREFYQVEEIDAEDCDDAKILDLPYYEVEEWS